MALGFDSLAAIYAHGYDALIDVRSPAEFAEDHIPGAISLPVLSNAERAHVGTIYTQQSAFGARKIGAAIVARNAAAHLDGPLAEFEGGWRPLVYCWRGGQRSGSFASILKQVGWRAETIEGGYRTYRRLVSAAMYDQPLAHRLIVLEGNTGTAKTELLHLLAARGVQMVDLEGLAAHRGSVFGAVARPQPSQKAFEGALAAQFQALDPARPVLVEAESSKVGNLLIPPTVWKAMKDARRMRIDAPIEARAAYLTRAYADISANAEALNQTLAALIPHQGRDRVEHWQALAQSGDLTALAQELMELHYDPSYGRVRERRGAQELGVVRSGSLTPKGLQTTADRLIGLLVRAGEISGQTQA
jgi:tRNA 2-selenouridine synthase